MKFFAEKLKSLRKSYNMSQSELAEAIFVSRSAVAKWEQGRGFPSIDSLQLIANKFCISIDELVNDEQTEFAQTMANKKLSVKTKILISLIPVFCLVLAVSITLAAMFVPRSMYNYIKLDTDKIDMVYVNYTKKGNPQTKYLEGEYYGEFLNRIKKIKVIPEYKVFKAQTEVTYYLESGGKVYYIRKDGAGIVGKGKKFSIYSGDFYALLELFGLELDDNVLPL